jgi:hypothetical protein
MLALGRPSGPAARNPPGMVATMRAASKKLAESTTIAAEAATANTYPPRGGPRNRCATVCVSNSRPLARSSSNCLNERLASRRATERDDGVDECVPQGERIWVALESCSVLVEGTRWLEFVCVV